MELGNPCREVVRFAFASASANASALAEMA